MANRDNRRRILVADDSEELRDTYRAILEAAGYEVMTAANGAEALERAVEFQPDLIISDVVMPEMDGLELLEKLQTRLAPPLPPVILCSGFELTEREALARGALMFLRKPFDRDDLLEYVAHGLEQRRVPAQSDARGRAHAQATRQCAREMASAVVENMGARAQPPERTLTELGAAPLDWLRAYLGLDRAAILLVEGGALRVLATSTDGVAPPATESVAALRELRDVVESGSTLVVPGVARHPCFRHLAAALPQASFFAGVPLSVDDGTVIGMLCVADRRDVKLAPEDLAILQHFARRGSLILGRLAAAGRMRGRDGDGMGARSVLTADMFTRLLELETEQLRRSGGSIALALIDGVDDTDVETVAATVQRATVRLRLAAGTLRDGRVALSQRTTERHAAVLLRRLLDSLLQARGPFDAIGLVEIDGERLPAFTGDQVLRIAGLALDEAMNESAREADVDIMVRLREP